MSRGNMSSRNYAFTLAILIFLSIIPAVNAAAEVSLNAFPMTQESDPGTTAEYTISVNNDGSDDITVTLSASQGPECTGYTSTVEQPQGAISAGDSVDVMLYVNLSAQPAESCDTTVQAAAQSISGPGNGEITVTTTAGEGSGGSTYGVELSTDHPEEKTWNGNDEEIIWPVTVKNTGQFNESINLEAEMIGSSNCDTSGLQYDIDPQQVSLDAGDEEEVTFTVTGMEDEHLAFTSCFLITATITNAPPGQDEENNTDELELELEIPEIKDCSFTSSSISVGAAPFESTTARFTVQNEGNADFNIAISSSGSKSSWVQDIEPGSGELELGTNYVFDVLVQPDNSVNAGQTVSITIRASEQGGGVLCSSSLDVTIGQFHDGEIEFIGNVAEIQPGSTGSAQIHITNTGNGPDSYSVSIEANEPAGWSSSFYAGDTGGSINSISVDQGQSVTVFLNISVPLDALADDAVVYTIELLRNNELLDEDATSVPVAERHGIDIDVTITSQSGKDGATVSYPFTVTNDGNVADNYNLVVSKNSCTSSDGSNSDWDVRFFEDGTNAVEINMVNIPAQTTKNLLAKVTIDGGEKSQCRSTVQILNTADQLTLQKTFNITTTSSNLIFRMNAFFENPGDVPNQVEVTQAPGGSAEFVFWIQNDGVFYGNPQEDNAVISIRSIDGVEYELNVNKNGVITDGSESIPVPMKYVLRNLTSGEFYVGGDGEILEFSDMNEANNTWLAGGLVGTHEIILFAIQVTIILNIDEDVEDGNGGTVYIDVRSEHNAEYVKTLEVVLKIETIHDLKIEAVGSSTKNIEYPDNAIFELRVYNDGNTNERVVVAVSEGLRGWIPLVPDSDDLEFSIAPGEFRVITIKVESPESTLSDDFEFTVSVQPKDASGMIGRKNIELQVIGEEASGFLPSFGHISALSCIAIAAICSMYFERRKTEI